MNETKQIKVNISVEKVQPQGSKLKFHCIHKIKKKNLQIKPLPITDIYIYIYPYCVRFDDLNAEILSLWSNGV
jgi:hypothetical protein